ncbi:uncharacterized protein LOC105845902 [Hydra vulgaris]|uniref:uncharacterized protein LOC105845902 n=1 Tax=Hydra vulgaris TaxID=6087 RepID=UPI001F5EA8B5|nr:uncharacterized protein LOC105845902 [Hydra vulgaris]
MWYYFVAHIAYHFTRCFPKDGRCGARIFVMFVALLFLLPQFIVLIHPTTSRYCVQPILNMLVVSICMTFVMLAFTFLFTMMEPVPWKLKIGFHFFGFFSLIIGLVQFGITVDSNCSETIPELYLLSLSFGIFSLVSAIFLLLLIPFWFVNFFWPGSVLSLKERRGICYEPVKSFSCVWHV